ncbi:MAG: hypothetical protein Q9221_006508 [Calogaya cf. arnoldii]
MSSVSGSSHGPPLMSITERINELDDLRHKSLALYRRHSELDPNCADSTTNITRVFFGTCQPLQIMADYYHREASPQRTEEMRALREHPFETTTFQKHIRRIRSLIAQLQKREDAEEKERNIKKDIVQGLTTWGKPVEGAAPGRTQAAFHPGPSRSPMIQSLQPDASSHQHYKTARRMGEPYWWTTVPKPAQLNTQPAPQQRGIPSTPTSGPHRHEISIHPMEQQNDKQVEQSATSNIRRKDPYAISVYELPSIDYEEDFILPMEQPNGKQAEQSATSNIRRKDPKARNLCEFLDFDVTSDTVRLNLGKATKGKSQRDYRDFNIDPELQRQEDAGDAAENEKMVGGLNSKEKPIEWVPYESNPHIRGPAGIKWDHALKRYVVPKTAPPVSGKATMSDSKREHLTIWTTNPANRPSGPHKLPEEAQCSVVSKPTVAAAKQTPQIPIKQSPVGQMVNKDVKTPEVKSPDVKSPAVKSDQVKSDQVKSPDIKSLDVKSPDIKNPDVASPEVKSPGVASPKVKSPDVESPEVKSPEVKSPAIVFKPTVAAAKQTLQTPTKQSPTGQFVDIDINTPDVKNPDVKSPKPSSKHVTHISTVAAVENQEGWNVVEAIEDVFEDGYDAVEVVEAGDMQSPANGQGNDNSDGVDWDLCG